MKRARGLIRIIENISIGAGAFGPVFPPVKIQDKKSLKGDQMAKKEKKFGGLQQTAYERLMEIAVSIREGKYGWGDDFDASSLENDLNDATADIE